MIYENGDLVAEAERFALHEELLCADIDLDRIAADRASTNSFGDSIHDHRARLQAFRRVEFALGVPDEPVPLERVLERFPYVPADLATRNERCYEVYNIQVHGLETRLRATGIKKVVIGVTGGLDSTHALIVIARAMDRLGLPRENILAYTMPGFATGEHTKGNAWKLMRALGVSAEEIDIRPSCEQMLRDIGHPYARGEKVYDITFENVQAGERTSHLFRLANLHDAIVIGTGDLSELALGWATYGVGDHMSHYSVNASVPKSLIRFLLALGDRDQAVRRRGERGPAVGDRHRDLARARPRGRRRALAGLREQRRPVRAAGLPSLLHAALRLPAVQGRLHGVARVGRRGAARGRPDPARGRQ